MLGASESWGGLFFKELDFSGTCADLKIFVYVS
jgi:hypothetical protein